MNHFWDTSETIPDGLGFSYFGKEHMICLLLCGTVLLVGTFAYRMFDKGQRRRFRNVLVAVLLSAELFKQIALILTGRWLPCYLPFHLCNVNIFIILWHSVRPNTLLSNFLYGICLPAAVAAILFPGWDDLPAWNFMYIHSWILHVSLALYPMALFVVGDIKPRLKDAWKSLLLLAGMALVLYCFNNWMQKIGIHVNFFFLRTVAKNNPLYFFQKIWGNHLYGFPFVVVVVFTIMYLPIEIKRMK